LAQELDLEIAMIAAILVVYYPDVSLLGAVLRAVIGQVNQVFVVDNTPEPSIECASLLEGHKDRILCIQLNENKGIAAAQNIAIGVSLGSGYSHVLLLDQDSVLPDGLIKKLLKAEGDLIRSGANVGAVGPLFIDTKTGNTSYAIRYGWFRAKKFYIPAWEREPVEADWLISSGSLIRASVFKEVGLMRDELFIDWVDAEWGLRARNKGFKSFIVPDVVMEHSIGDASEKFLDYTFTLHSISRNYYIVRNSTYLLSPKRMGWKWMTAMALRIPKHIAVHSWYSPNRWRSFSVMVLAALDGFRGRLGPSTDTGKPDLT
jgi:rhamnosyltransferase